MRELERYGGARFALYRGNWRQSSIKAPNEAVISCVPRHKRDEDRWAMRSLSSLTSFDGAGFKNILQECKEAQSTYLDDWVSGIHCDNPNFEEGNFIMQQQKEREEEYSRQ